MTLSLVLIAVIFVGAGVLHLVKPDAWTNSSVMDYVRTSLR